VSFTCLTQFSRKAELDAVRRGRSPESHGWLESKAAHPCAEAVSARHGWRANPAGIVSIRETALSWCVLSKRQTNWRESQFGRSCRSKS